MNTDKSGGHVFPQAARSGDMAISEGGITLLDHFACQAMQGMLADPTVTHTSGAMWSSWCADIATESYDIADAMIAERARRAELAMKTDS